eukprot:CAMPEP_0203811530 /NCGR_PEP_ID=MMETSP0115-20131106/3619_1 /ASSEMBLY_ACC=CAM_ASM_000227 /TAXON_ID=33651 /ORGANISM="Bicosoecid sp, Strain ms1" /LENGTH=112 /DNA_ID=CAMNT_0050720355 /DNA_START=41 /DNA_END=376 /DNA_ORIENTATION=+
MGRVYLTYLDGDKNYVCTGCHCHLARAADILNDSFHGRHGRAYLFDNAVNVLKGPREDRILMTGLHTVRDVFCARCSLALGWTYDEAFEASQKYKEGKFVIEKVRMARAAAW